MYWIDLGPGEASPAILLSGMDGSNFKEIVTSMLLEPTGLAIDYSNNDTLYWCDSKKNSLEFIFSDGTSRGMIAESFGEPGWFLIMPHRLIHRVCILYSAVVKKRLILA